MANPATFDALWPGSPYPRGATWDGLGVNFALFSESAERVEVCLFDSTGRHEVQRIALREQTDQVWHGYLPQARPGLLYGFRVHGPYKPRQGHRFNGQKLLLDPYARSIVGNLRWHDALFGYRIGHGEADLSIDRRDSAPYMPRCKVVESAFSWGDDRPLARLVSLRRGALQWRFDTGSAIIGSPTIVNGVIYFGAADHTLYALPT